MYFKTVIVEQPLLVEKNVELSKQKGWTQEEFAQIQYDCFVNLKN